MIRLFAYLVLTWHEKKKKKKEPSGICKRKKETKGKIPTALAKIMTKVLCIKHTDYTLGMTGEGEECR